MSEQKKYVYFFGAGQTEGNANMLELLFKILHSLWNQLLHFIVEILGDFNFVDFIATVR